VPEFGLQASKIGGGHLDFLAMGEIDDEGACRCVRRIVPSQQIGEVQVTVNPREHDLPGRSLEQRSELRERIGEQAVAYDVRGQEKAKIGSRQKGEKGNSNLVFIS
jgi:hypothetical protein